MPHEPATTFIRRLQPVFFKARSLKTRGLLRYWPATSGQQNGLAISRTNYRSALTGVLGVCLGVLGVCLGVWIYIYMDLSEGLGITKCKGQGNGGLH